jgi:SAM-dependent methyltransferase
MAEMTAVHRDAGRIGVLLRNVRRQAKRLLRVGRPDIGAVRWADLRRTTPIGTGWGFDRGTPVDRDYIEEFLCEHAVDIAGHVLEVKDANYTHRFGGERVTQSAVLDVDAKNSAATIITDLNNAVELPSGAFDCIILTQTLHLIYEFRSAINHLERSLAPSGVLLLTVPGITRVPRSHDGTWYWSFTTDSVQHLLEEYFPPSLVQVCAHGNILAATAFLHGLAREELRKDELDVNDPEYPLIISARAQKKPVE